MSKTINQATPLVSVLVPIYNVECYIERCTRSILEQTYKHLEFLFLDDCSTDASMTVLDRIIHDYPLLISNIQIIHHEKHKGLSTTRNTLIKHANGDFVFHVDSDDWLEPNAIELFVKKQQETKADIVQGRSYVHKNNKIEELVDDGSGLNREDFLSSLFFMKCHYVVVWNKLINRDLYIKNNIKCNENLRVKEDHILFYLIYFASSIVYVDEFTYHYDCTPKGSISQSFGKSLQISKDIVLITEQICFYFQNKNSIYKDLSSIYKYKLIKSFLLLSYENKNKDSFCYLVSFWENLPMRLWTFKDNSLLQFFESNFFLTKLIMPILVKMIYILNLAMDKAE